MDSFYFIRHGQTDANQQGLMCGSSWNIELNETGVQQAKKASNILFEENIQFNTIISSPMKRATQTSQIIGEKLGIAIQIEDGLTEWDIGKWDRMPFESVKNDFLGDGEPESGETRAQFKNRIELALQKTLKLKAPLLIVSHGAVWLTLQEILEIPPSKMDNGTPVHIYRDQSWQMKAL